MGEVIEAYERWVGLLAGIIGGAAVILLMVHTVINAITRSFLNSPVTGTLEYAANWYLPLIVLIGLVLAQQRGQHIDAPLLFDKAPSSVQRELTAISMILMIAVSFFFAWYGYLEADHARSIELTAGVSGVVIWPAMYAVPVGFILLAIQALITLVRALWPSLIPVADRTTEDEEIQPQAAEEGESRERSV